MSSDPVERIREFYEVADARPMSTEQLAAFFADEFVDHDPNPEEGPLSAEEEVATYAMLADGAPDSVHHLTFVEAVGDDKALVRWRFEGTHTGELFGIPATGQRFDIAGMELWEFETGKITGLWHVEEIATLLAQLGVA